MMRRDVQRGVTWFIAGYLFSVISLAMIGVFAMPKTTQAIGVCDVGGACYTSEACEEAGGDFRSCGGGSTCASKTIGCGKCKAGEGYCYPKPTPVKLSVHIGGKATAFEIAQYLEYVYDYAISIAAGIAGVMIMIGGFQYLTAGGAADRVSGAKKRISDALVGLALTLGAFLILNTISPDLVRLNEIRVPMIQKKTFSACNPLVMKVKCGEKFGLAGDPPKVGPGETCTGQSCRIAGANDAFYQCADSNPDNRPKLGTPVEPYECIVCDDIGEPCTDIGDSDQCCTGFCAANSVTGGGTCRSGEPGSACQGDGECKSGKCQQQSEFTTGTVLAGSCTEGLFGSPCDSSDDCSGGHTCIADVCSFSVPYGGCSSDTDCPTDYECETLAGADGNDVCVPKGNIIDSCSSDSGCPPGYYCNVALLFGNCVPREGGPVGSVCAQNADCKSNHCVGAAYTGTTGLCSDGGIGARCDDKADCENQKCFDAGVWKVCVSGEEWSGCGPEATCKGGLDLRCDTNNNRCIAK